MTSSKFLYLKDDAITKIICSYFELNLKLTQKKLLFSKKIDDLLLLIYFYNVSHPKNLLTQQQAMLNYGSSYQNFFTVLRDLEKKDIIIKSVSDSDKRKKLLTISTKGKLMIKDHIDDLMNKVYSIAKERNEDAINGFIDFTSNKKNTMNKS